jgi:hypothetical protein
MAARVRAATDEVRMLSDYNLFERKVYVVEIVLVVFVINGTSPKTVADRVKAEERNRRGVVKGG